MEGNKGGRPTKFKEEYVEQSFKLCRKGFTDADMADFFNVDVATINRWKKAHPEFCASLNEGKQYFDDKVVDALYNRAIGYTITEEREEDSEASGKKTVKVTKQVAGDTTAQIFWLKNRQPAMWRDKQETHLSGTVNNVNYTPADYANAQANLESKLDDLD